MLFRSTEAEFKTWIEQAKKAASASPEQAPAKSLAKPNVLAAADATGSKEIQR